MNLITDTYKVGQIQQEMIPDNVRFHLETKASFSDTDTTINECIVSLGDIEQLIEGCRVDETIARFQEILDQMNELGLSYIHITKV